MVIFRTICASLLMITSVMSWAEALEEFRLWEIQDENLTRRGYLLGVIDLIPLADSTQKAAERLYQLFPSAIEALRQSNLVVVESSFALGIKPTASLDAQILDCTRGLGNILNQEEMVLAKQKLSRVLREDSIYYRYAYCLNPMKAVSIKQLKVEGDYSDNMTGTTLDAIIGLGEKTKFFDSLEQQNEREEPYLSLSASIQRKNTLRWLLRNEDLVLEYMDINEYNYYRNLIIDCYLEDESCIPLNMDKKFIQAIYAPGTYPDDGVNSDIKHAIIENRSIQWLPTILNFLTYGDTIAPLFAVGLYHLGGDKGLVAMLRFLGYTLSPIKMRLLSNHETSSNHETNSKNQDFSLPLKQFELQ